MASFTLTHPSNLLGVNMFISISIYTLSAYVFVPSFVGKIFQQPILNDIGRNRLLGHTKKIAKFLMKTFTCRSIPSSMIILLGSIVQQEGFDFCLRIPVFAGASY